MVMIHVKNMIHSGTNYKSLRKDVNKIYLSAMQLTMYTDYALRTLVYLGLHQDRLCTISEIADAYGISRNHLVKITHHLGKTDYVRTIRGKSGGMRLATQPRDINIGQIIRITEPHMNILECFDAETNTCPISAACALKHALYQARTAFMDVLDGYTLADVLDEQDYARDLLDSNLSLVTLTG